MPVPLVVDRELTDDWNQVLRAYARIDRNRVRSQAHGLYAARIHEELEIPQDLMRFVVPAVRLLMSGFEGSGVDRSKSWMYRNNDLIARRSLEWRAEIKTWFACSGLALRGLRLRLNRAAVMAVGLTTLRYQGERAEPFWKKVATMDRLEPETGAWHLVNFVSTRSLEEVRESSRYVAKYWNAHFEDRKIKLALIRNEDDYIHILGTPYRRDSLITLLD